jgi:metal-sulfur cluster biosynthetic enzyme
MSAVAAAALPAELDAQVTAALGTVLDPCSVYNGTRLSFLDLGMIDRIELRGAGHLSVRLLLDDPVCLYVGQISHELRTALLGVPEIAQVDIEFSGDEIWTDERATAPVRARIRAQRQERLAAIRARRGNQGHPSERTAR